MSRSADILSASDACDARAREIIATAYPHFRPGTPAYRAVAQLRILSHYAFGISLALESLDRAEADLAEALTSTL